MRLPNRAPRNPQSLNRYSYVLNNPLRYIDPTGHFADGGNDGDWHDGGGVGSSGSEPGGSEGGVAGGAEEGSVTESPTDGHKGEESVKPTPSETFTNKADLRQALRNGIKGVTQGQIQRLLKALGDGRMDRMVIRVLKGGLVQLVADRAGRDGFQRLIYTIDSSGKLTGLLQEAYNAAGELVHVHDKLTNTIIK